MRRVPTLDKGVTLQSLLKEYICDTVACDDIPCKECVFGPEAKEEETLDGFIKLVRELDEKA